MAVIAHVDHGKTSLVNSMLAEAGLVHVKFGESGFTLDSMTGNPLEREKGVTILSKIIGMPMPKSDGVRLNIIDTPGHADFGGEVERVLGMADGCLLIVDAAEGPMPQTRFVLQKAFELHLRPIVVINKVDRRDARAEWVLEQTSDLFLDLATDAEQLDFPGAVCHRARGQGGVAGRTSWRTRSSRCSARSSTTCRRPRAIGRGRCRCRSPRSTTTATRGGSPSGACDAARSAPAIVWCA